MLRSANRLYFTRSSFTRSSLRSPGERRVSALRYFAIRPHRLEYSRITSYRQADACRSPNRCVNYLNDAKRDTLLRPAAVDHLPADAGSIGHVADAASVRSGKFIPAARLTTNRIHLHDKRAGVSISRVTTRAVGRVKRSETHQHPFPGKSGSCFGTGGS